MTSGSKRTYDSINHFGSDKSEFHLIRAETRLPPPSGLADTFLGQFVADDWPVLPDMFRHGCADVVQEGSFGRLRVPQKSAPVSLARYSADRTMLALWKEKR